MEENQKEKKKYFTRDNQEIITPELCDKIREKLKFTHKQLSDATIRKVCILNNKLIGQWVINNADGFRIRNNGIIIVSKYLPKCLRGDKQETIEAIMNNPKNDDYMKKMFVARYEKALTYYKNFNKKSESKYNTNIHSFFYLYRVIWFNSRNCAFKKAELYELQIDKAMKKALNEKVIEGKEYYEWNFSDFRERKRDKLKPKKANE